jgi:hypothetical protein
MSPYEKYKNSELWIKLNDILKELEENQDIEITTHRDYVIGYLCENLQQEFQVIKKSLQ